MGLTDIALKLHFVPITPALHHSGWYIDIRLYPSMVHPKTDPLGPDSLLYMYKEDTAEMSNGFGFLKCCFFIKTLTFHALSVLKDFVCISIFYRRKI